MSRFSFNVNLSSLRQAPAATQSEVARAIPAASGSMRRLQIQLSLSNFALVFLTSVLGVVGLGLYDRVSSENLRVADLSTEVQSMRSNLYRQVKEVIDDVLLGDPEAVQQFAQLSAAGDDQFARLTTLLRTAEEQRAASDLRLAYVEVRELGDRMIREARESPPDRSEQQRVLHTGIEHGSLQRYERALVAMRDIVAHERAERGHQLLVLKRWVGAGLLLSLVCGFALLALSSELLHRRFARPLSDVLASIRRISQGQLEHRVTDSGVAEIRELALGINTMSSELSASRLKLVHAEKQAMLGSLVPVVAHNIRNPLASIRATAQIIDAPALPADVREGLHDIISASDRLESWTHSLLSYLNPLQPNCQWVTLQTVVETCLGLLSARTAERELSIRRMGWDAPVRVEADVALVEQALTGLLMNAIEASPVRGQVTLAADTDGGIVRLSIRDQGSGMAVLPSASRRLTMRSTKPQGNGLGIPFCRKVCEGHGGQLNFVGHADGTEVIVTLPQKAVHLAT